MITRRGFLGALAAVGLVKAPEPAEAKPAFDATPTPRDCAWHHVGFCADTACECHTDPVHRVSTPFPDDVGFPPYCCNRCARQSLTLTGPPLPVGTLFEAPNGATFRITDIEPWTGK